MSVGTVLVRPQRVRLAAGANAESALLADVRTLVAALTDDAARAEPVVLPALQAACERLAERLATRLQGGLQKAVDRLAGLVDGPLQRLLAAVEVPADQSLTAMFTLLADAVDAAAGLELGDVERTLGEVLHALQDDLGLTPALLVEQALETLADAAATVEPHDAAAARALRRLSRVVAAAEVPVLDAAQLASLAMAELRRRGIDDLLRLLRCAVGEVSDTATALRDLVGAVPTLANLNADVPVPPIGGGADERHAWYATWLLGFKRPTGASLGLALVPWEGPDEVWVVDGRIERRNEVRDNQQLGNGTSYEQALVFQAATATGELEKHGLEGHYTFERHSAETMETIALVSAIAMQGVEMFAHIFRTTGGRRLPPISQVFANGIWGFAGAVTQKPVPSWLELVLGRTLLPGLTSLHGIHTNASAGNCFNFWLTLIGQDILGNAVLHLAPHLLLRDPLLSILTLRNHKQPEDGSRPPQNRLEYAGLSALSATLAGILAGLLVPKGDYGFAGNLSRIFGIHGLLVGPLFTFLGYLTGWLIGRPLAGTNVRDDFGHGLKESAIAAALTVVKFLPSLYLGLEGNTNGGKFNARGADFSGYPDRASSPYRLPYAADTSCYLNQANQGLFSHHAANGEVYAYDFGLDQDTDVLAARPGTVWDFAEGFADENTANANFIMIRHDVDDSGNPIPPDAAHDRGPGGAVAVTYARYLHGRQNSITAAFGGTTPVPRTTQVRRGQKIMASGDTGNSFHNHLHMTAHVDDGTGTAHNSESIPLVFREVEHNWPLSIFRDDGVPFRGDSYTSENRP